MSKTKVIEVFERTQMIMQIGTDTKDRVTTVAVSADELETLNSDYINEHYGSLQNEAYQRGYDKGYADKTNNDEVGKELAKDIYQRGLEDGRNETWEVTRKIALGLNDGGFSTHYLKEVFGSISFQYAFKNYSATEAIEKLKAYEEKQKAEDDIKVGDEVTDTQSGTNFLVTHLWESNHGDKGVSGFNNECSAFSTTLDKVSKTGKHYDIEKILDEMKRED